MTFEQAFLKVKEKFEHADASGTADFAVQVTFTDSDCGGTFYAEVKDGKLAVEPYNYYDNNALLNITKSALLAYLAGRTTLDKVIAAGDARAEGDISKIADWKAMLKKAPAAKKTPVKKASASAKTASKKTAAKKAAPAKKDTKTAAKTKAKKDTSASVKSETKKDAKTPAPAKTAKSTK